MLNDLGTVVAIVAALLFYIRLIILQRNRSKAAQHINQLKAKKKSMLATSANSFSGGLIISSWPLMIAGVVLILAGAGIAMATNLGQAPRSLWWLPVTVGIALMTLVIR